MSSQNEKHSPINNPPPTYGGALWPDDEPQSPHLPSSTRWLELAPGILTAIAQGSAPFISTFLLVHLTAPAVAALGGSSLASQVMILGREYYQTPIFETYLVKLPIGLHIAASVLKRAILYALSASARSSAKGVPRPSTSILRPRPLRSLLAWTGLISATLLLPVHYWTHRVAPSLSSPSILSVGPAELDFEFVKTALQSWPIRSFILYFGLTAFVTAHAAEGTALLVRSFGATPPSRIPRHVGAAICTTPVLVGVYMLSKEPMFVFSGLADRYRAALSTSLWYRI